MVLINPHWLALINTLQIPVHEKLWNAMNLKLSAFIRIINLEVWAQLRKRKEKALVVPLLLLVILAIVVIDILLVVLLVICFVVLVILLLLVFLLLFLFFFLLQMPLEGSELLLLSPMS